MELPTFQCNITIFFNYCGFPRFVWYIEIRRRRDLIFCRKNIWSAEHKKKITRAGWGNKSLVHKHLQTLWDVTYSFGFTQFPSRLLCLHTASAYFFVHMQYFIMISILFFNDIWKKNLRRNIFFWGKNYFTRKTAL